MRRKPDASGAGAGLEQVTVKIRKLNVGAAALMVSVLLAACRGDAATPDLVEGALDNGIVTMAAGAQTPVRRTAGTATTAEESEPKRRPAP